MTVHSEITADDLIAGASSTFDVEVPPEVLHPGPQGRPGNGEVLTVRLRPLSIGVFQLIMRAAKQDAGLIPVLMIKESLVHPEMSLEQVKQLHLGLVSFLISHIREISGLAEKKNPERSS